MGEVPSPYRGLVPYEETDAAFFFGRTPDIERITANLLASRLTLLYGSSGVGKSSVLNAGVVPELRLLAASNREQGGRPELAVVVFRDWAHSPARALTMAVRQACAAAMGVPADLTNLVNLVDELRQCAAQVGGDVLIILDQFEEHFLYTNHPQDAESFDDALVSALTDGKLAANFLVSIREDGLAKLDQFKGRIPRLFDNYLRMQHLDGAAGREAIERPIKRHNERYRAGQPAITLDDGLVDTVLREVQNGRVTISDAAVGAVAAATDDRIETPFLQLVMTRLWQTEIGQGSTELRRATFVETLGGARKIVQSHVTASLQSLTPEEKQLAVTAFRYLITPSHSKIALRAADLAAIADLPLPPLTNLLEKLTGSGYRLLKPVAPPPDRPGAVSYEIWHDVLAQSILDWRAESVRVADLAAARARAEADLAVARQKTAERDAAARRSRRTAIVIFICLLISLAAGAWGFWQSRTAQIQARNAQWRKLIADARIALATDPELGVLLATEALHQTTDARSEIALEAADALALSLAASRVRESFKMGRAAVVRLGVANRGSGIAGLGENQEVFLFALDGGSARKLAAPASPVHDMAVTPDGSGIALALQDKTLQILDASDGALKKSVTLPHEAGAIAWSPNGQTVATATHDGGVSLSNASSGEQVRQLETFLPDSRHRFTFLDFSPDGRRLAGAGSNGEVWLWSVGDGAVQQKLCGHRDILMAVRFSPDNRFLATSSMDSLAMLWDVSDQGAQSADCRSEPLRRFVGHFNTVFDVSFSPDGETLATGSADTTVRLWDVNTGTPLLTLVGHRDPVERIVFVDDQGERLASASWDGTIRVWDVTAPANVYMASDSPGGSRIVMLSQDGRATVRETATGDVYRQGRFPGSTNIALDHSGQYAATASVRRIDYWTLAESKEPVSWNAHSDEVTALAVSPDGQLVASGGNDGFTRIWDAKTGKKLAEAEYDFYVKFVGFSPDGRFLLTNEEDGATQLWDISPLQKRELPGHKDRITSSAWSRNGQWLATSGMDGNVFVWSLPKGGLAHTLKHSGRVFEVDFSPDSQRLLAVGEDNRGRRFDVASGREILPALAGHEGWVATGRFSPDGRLIATGSWDRTARIWDATNGKQVARYTHDDALRNIVFSPDSQALSVVTEAAQFRYIPLRHEQLLHLARSRAKRTLSEAECRVYLLRESCPSQ